MKFNFSISLKKRLAITYALWTSLALGALAIVINIFTSFNFNVFVKENIARISSEIVLAITSQFNPWNSDFDTAGVEAIGMHFVHEGYIIRVEDAEGAVIWDARSCDMEQCMRVIDLISERMEGRFGLEGALQAIEYPLYYAEKNIGRLSIETYGPLFYSETETRFLTSINRLLLFASAMLTAFSIALSIVLAVAISGPIEKAKEAARSIALSRRSSAMGGGGGRLVRIKENYKTRELAALASAINGLADELEDAERRQKQFSSDIAHELRTPLTCLQGNIEAMIDGVYQCDIEHLESCHEEIKRLGSLVQDLHTLSSLEWENINLNKTEFDLAEALRSAAGQFRAQARDKGIEIRLELAGGKDGGEWTEALINADYDRLKQVFINLLSNAIKYTDSGSITIGLKKIDAESGARGGGFHGGGAHGGTVHGGGAGGVRGGAVSLAGGAARWELSIADTGIGIPEEDLPHIFERLYRADKSRSRGTGGAGIGLSIALAIVRAHGGTLYAENYRHGEEKGAVLRLLLP